MREIVRVVACSLVIALSGTASAQRFVERVREASGRVALLTPDGVVRLHREWDGAVCRSRLTNEGETAARIGEVVLFDIRHDMPDETAFYGEGLQMLSQTGGTLGELADIGVYTDRGHYRIPEPAGARAVYGVMTLSPPGGGHALLGFTSCKRFIGKFYVSPGRLQVVIDCEGLELAPGQSWELEPLLAAEGPGRADLLAGLAERINANHPPIFEQPVATGWCSWYCFGPGVTAKNIEDNLEVIAEQIPELEYIQIDDGYQPWMGDWLDTGDAFGGRVQDVLATIRERGFEPAIWLAPFVASPESRLFAEHPDWFVKGADGEPLVSKDVTFGGWRLGPWYVLDATNPQVLAYYEDLFRTMREEWGCTYFKLDAIAWPVVLRAVTHPGKFHDPDATSVEAYRRGMEAIRRGAGESFILGCNHPIWASLGLIHGSRSSLDIVRRWEVFRDIGLENMHRTWQNGTLWWNDPDCIVLTGDLPENEFVFHATWIFASGGMLLSGDDLTTISPARMEMLRKLIPPTGVGAAFEDQSCGIGLIDLGERAFVCAFNWDDAFARREIDLEGRWEARDFWTGEDLGVVEGTLDLGELAGRHARLIELRSIGRFP